MPTADEIMEETNELMKRIIGNCLILGSQGLHIQYSNTGKDYLVSLTITETEICRGD